MLVYKYLLGEMNLLTNTLNVSENYACDFNKI